MSITHQPLFRNLDGARKVLLAGAGGGFDVFCGLPLYFALVDRGVQVQLANLSFSALRPTPDERLDPVSARVTADSRGASSYFPERALCEWFRARGQEVDIVCFERTGVAPLKESYRRLVEAEGFDTLVLVDGGTDSLMGGDEAGLGTPQEDVASLLSASAVDLERKLLVCVGFGVDRYHGVCHAQFLEAVAALSRQGAFLGATSLLPSMSEVQRYIDACDFVFDRMPDHVSIVNSSIVSAIEGAYGDVHRTDRTAGSRLWINPLMSLMWSFHLDPVADRILYRDLVAPTRTFMELTLYIEGYRKGVKIRPWEDIPV